MLTWPDSSYQHDPRWSPTITFHLSVYILWITYLAYYVVMKEKYLTVEAGFWISADLLPVLLSCRETSRTLCQKSSQLILLLCVCVCVFARVGLIVARCINGFRGCCPWTFPCFCGKKNKTVWWKSLLKTCLKSESRRARDSSVCVGRASYCDFLTVHTTNYGAVTGHTAHWGQTQSHLCIMPPIYVIICF